MTNRERECRTLSFEQMQGRGAVEETFYPWVLTTERFIQEGMPGEIARGAVDITNDRKKGQENPAEKYLAVSWGEGVMEYEHYLGFDPVRRVHFVLPFRRLEGQEEGKPIIRDQEEWEGLKAFAREELKIYFTDEAIQNAYGPLQEGHDRGDYSIRLNIEGFFWVPRELLGIEEHLYAFYDEPELLHDICAFMLEIYQDRLIRVIDVIKPDVVYIMEDLSGKNGPMISPAAFDEFVGKYYRQLIPLLKDHGAGHIFVDTDGDFNQIIPNFMAAGVEGFLPMDVNAGMDIVKVRQEFPDLKFIGGFNKLCIAQGREAIDQEFSRILPVIRGGGYIPGADHQVAPSTSLENYRYYIQKLGEVMEQAGADL